MTTCLRYKIEFTADIRSINGISSKVAHSACFKLGLFVRVLSRWGASPKKEKGERGERENKTF